MKKFSEVTSLQVVVGVALCLPLFLFRYLLANYTDISRNLSAILSALIWVLFYLSVMKLVNKFYIKNESNQEE